MMYHWCCWPLPLMRSYQVKFQDYNKQECERGVDNFNHHQSRITQKGVSVRDCLHHVGIWACLWGILLLIFIGTWKSTLHRGWHHSLFRRFSTLWGWRKWREHKHVIVNITWSFLPSSCHSGFLLWQTVAWNWEHQWAISPISWFYGVFSHSNSNKTYLE